MEKNVERSGRRGRGWGREVVDVDVDVDVGGEMLCSTRERMEI